MINLVVEGASDVEVAKAVVTGANHSVNRVLVTRGKAKLDERIANYNRAAVQFPWVVFRDSDAVCPVRLREQLTQRVGEWNSKFSLRIAHSMSEAWLLADRDRFAEYFGVPASRVPAEPEALPHAKRTVLALCATSRSRAIRGDMTFGGDQVGPLYVPRINEFASTVWQPLEAAESSESLRRAIDRIRELPEG